MTENISLNEISRIIDCEHKTAPLEEEGYPSIRTPNIGKGRLLLDGVNRVSEKTYQLWTRRAKPEPGDIILAREAPVGNAALIPPNLNVCLGQRTVLIKPNKNKICPEYLNYLLNSETINFHLLNISTGATVGHLNVTDIRKLKLPPIPSILVQKKIAAILTAYDDLIEINNQRIQILEKMAEEIYREWFVRMRFPGYKKAKFIKGIPEKWSIKKVIDANEFQFIDRNLNSFDGEKEYYATSEVNGININEPTELITFNNKPSRAQYIPLLYSVWFARMKNTFKLIAFSDSNVDGLDNIVLSSGFAGFKTSKELFPFLYLTIKSNTFHSTKDLYTTGATQESLTNDGLKKIKILLPEISLMKDFSLLAFPMINQLLNLQNINKKLDSIRNLFLPRLFSGKLSVENIKIKCPPSMEEVNA